MFEFKIEFTDRLDGYGKERKGRIEDDFHISVLSNCVDCHAINCNGKTKKKIEVGRILKNHFHGM